MHPEISSDRPGLCSECGMSLVLAGEKGHGHGDGGKVGADKHRGHKTNIFARKFWVSAVLSLPVIAYSKIFEIIFGQSVPNFPGSEYIPFVLGSLVFFYGGWIFLTSAWREIRGRAPGMMTLIALAISIAYGYSLAVTFGFAGEALYWEITTLIAIMLLGHWLEMRAVTGAQGALKELAKLLPDTAEVARNGQTETVPLAELRVGDFVMIRPGGRVPADGRVSEGQSHLDEAMITGESRPVEKKVGDEVIGGTINKDGSLKVEIIKIGDDTFLSGVMRLVKDAQASKSKTQLLADKAAFYLTIIAIVVGIGTFVGWMFFTTLGVSFAIQRLVAVMVITCPHALGVAIPLVASISTTKAAKNGFLVRERSALEAARKVDVVLFDKTGTLTTGGYGVEKIWAFVDEKEENEVLRTAGSVDSHSEHYIAKAIVDEAKKRELSLDEVAEFSRIAGRGVGGVVGGKKVYVGGAAIIEHVGLEISEAVKVLIEVEEKKGKTIIFVIKEKELMGAIALIDQIRKESSEAVEALKALGVKTAMITGDSEDVAKWVAGELGLDEYYARVLPGEKAEKVKDLQNKGLKVVMVGDGINDAPALTTADIGVAIGAGTNVAIESAGIILMRSDPRDIVKIIRLSKMTYNKMIQNLFWATGYNVVAIPLAAGVLYKAGILLQPAVAAILMSASTVIVAINAVLLRGKELS
ncbi:MAG: copper-translocating P-type ATPase [Candidatus Harrisonbacteria bacterium CG10_big_fil_rev_8_21_14_0_10_45_28]|uniref:Copper-translocating P-type ATPase n=1 Tax=Candidatus Harrisonbacteria bacterium CG10_big_fil_rev_8_21_14_0_10_45_28 TaxID=1974586 RepID=A0A2H0UNU6_9BACT|nr:MAG: copper-translocating P-type ATPase [Candidatus Harrisonbacteria bacterium CG10_big_fil_rev_8_21_14_0_10_45_28]